MQLTRYCLHFYKMNTRLTILIIAIGCLALWGLSAIIQLIIVKNYGAEITAQIVRVDDDCDRYNSIDVLHDGKTYTVSISRDDCRNKVYNEGQMVKLIKYKENDNLLWPESQVNWLPLLYLAIVFLFYISNKDKFKTLKGS